MYSIFYSTNVAADNNIKSDYVNIKIFERGLDGGYID